MQFLFVDLAALNELAGDEETENNSKESLLLLQPHRYVDTQTGIQTKHVLL